MTNVEVIRALRNAAQDPCTPRRFKIAIHCSIDNHQLIESSAQLEIDRLLNEVDRLQEIIDTQGNEIEQIKDENQLLKTQQKLWIESMINAPEED